MTKHIQVGIVLQSLSQAMRIAGHWSVIGISEEALNSQQPFCLDTMNFNQWLQFVLIPRMQTLIDGQQTLPSFIKGQGIEPMASQFYSNETVDQNIIQLIRQFDGLLQN